jgi:hypothetical protein
MCESDGDSHADKRAQKPRKREQTQQNGVVVSHAGEDVRGKKADLRRGRREAFHQIGQEIGAQGERERGSVGLYSDHQFSSVMVITPQ